MIETKRALDGSLTLRFSLADFDVTTIGPTEEQKAEALRAMAQNMAKQRLWDHALASIEVSHPDPGVDVVLHTQMYWDTVLVWFNMHGLRDTSDRDKRFGLDVGRYDSPFRHRLLTPLWPGIEAARLALIGTWSTYMLHETLELVRPTDPHVQASGPVWWGDGTVEPRGHTWHPHAAGKCPQFVQALTAMQFEGSTTDGQRGHWLNMTSTIAVAVGFDEAERVVDKAMTVGRTELAIETDIILNGGEWQ